MEELKKVEGSIEKRLALIENSTHEERYFCKDERQERKAYRIRKRITEF